jgi:hypothetical protein
MQAHIFKRLHRAARFAYWLICHRDTSIARWATDYELGAR